MFKEAAKEVAKGTASLMADKYKNEARRKAAASSTAQNAGLQHLHNQRAAAVQQSMKDAKAQWQGGK